MLSDVDDEQEVITIGQDLAGPRVLEVAVVFVEAPQGLPARQAKHRLSRLPATRDLDVSDSSLHPDIGLQVVMGLAEVDLAVGCQDAEAAEIDQLVALDRGPAARVLPAADFHHDVHRLMVPSSSDVSKWLLRSSARWRVGDDESRPAARLMLVTQDVAALQLLVPEAEQLLDAVRGLAGVGLLEPAHISLGYPWRTAEAADPSVVRAAAARTRAFLVRFAEARTFPPDARGRVLVHVAPDDESPFHELARLVQADLRQVHLSVARVLKDGDVEEVVRRVVPLLPLVATVRLLELTVQRDGVWQPGQRFALTG